MKTFATRKKRAPRKPTHGGARKGAGRPPAVGSATALLQVRVSAELLAHVQAAAAVAGLSVPDYVRARLAGTLVEIPV
jgi:hypothetical protein